MSIFNQTGQKVKNQVVVNGSVAIKVDTSKIPLHDWAKMTPEELAALKEIEKKAGIQFNAQ